MRVQGARPPGGCRAAPCGVVVVLCCRQDELETRGMVVVVEAKSGSLESFVARLEMAAPGSAGRLWAFVEACRDLDATWAVDDGLVLRVGLPGQVQHPIAFEPGGTVQMPWLVVGHKEATRRFAKAVEKAVGVGAQAREAEKMWTVGAAHPERRPPLPIGAVLDAGAGVRAALAVLVGEIQGA